MNHLFAPVIFGLAASLCWGSGDFSGGLASRRANVASVVLTDYTVGLGLLVTLALIGKESVPAPVDLLWGGLAGVAGVLGLLSFYAALARGKMGIAAPVSAVLTAALPVLFSAFTAGLPTLLQLGGFALAGLSIGLISCPQRTTEPPKGGILLLRARGKQQMVQKRAVWKHETFPPGAVSGVEVAQPQVAPACSLMVALRRLNRLVVAIMRMMAARPFSSKCSVASSQISSGTASARSASRVAASVSARAARSASVK
ncbi:MAG TPA: EamA family transporter [Ktedonobacteraceae bacterium]